MFLPSIASISVGERISMEAADIEGLVRIAALEDLRAETTPAERARSLSQASTALEALCGLAGREGTGSVWDVLAELDRAQLLAFATFSVSELADHTGYRCVDYKVEPAAGGPGETDN